MLIRVVLNYSLFPSFGNGAGLFCNLMRKMAHKFHFPETHWILPSACKFVTPVSVKCRSSLSYMLSEALCPFYLCFYWQVYLSTCNVYLFKYISHTYMFVTFSKFLNLHDCKLFYLIVAIKRDCLNYLLLK